MQWFNVLQSLSEGSGKPSYRVSARSVAIGALCYLPTRLLWRQTCPEFFDKLGTGSVEGGSSH